MEVIYANELYEFLTEISLKAASLGKPEIQQSIDSVRHSYRWDLASGEFFHFPVTSEFLGEAMFALQEVLTKAPVLFSAEQARQARDYAESIKRLWFSA